MTSRISFINQRLTIHPSGVARLFGSSIDVPLAHVAWVAVSDPGDTRGWYHGVRLVGLQIPGLMTSGLFRRDGHLIWVDIGRGSRAIVIALRDERLARLVIGVDDPEAMKRSLEQALDANPASVTVVA
jgi:hypothetical protein